jgi:hypothetical protein
MLTVDQVNTLKPLYNEWRSLPAQRLRSISMLNFADFANWLKVNGHAYLVHEMHVSNTFGEVKKAFDYRFYQGC